MKRWAIAVLLALPMLVLAAPSALAAKPTHQREPIDDTLVDTSCGFPVQINTTGLLDTIQWVDSDGTTRTIETFPQNRTTFINLDTGTPISVNTAGPGQFTERADGSFTFVGTGTYFWLTHPQTDEPGLFLTAGRFVFSVDPAGNISFQIVGKITDLCSPLLGRRPVRGCLLGEAARRAVCHRRRGRRAWPIGSSITRVGTTAFSRQCERRPVIGWSGRLRFSFC
jgi:hypothetical protein